MEEFKIKTEQKKKTNRDIIKKKNVAGTGSGEERENLVPQRERKRQRATLYREERE